MSDFYKARDVIDKFDPVLKSYKFVRRRVECTPINQYDRFLAQFMDFVHEQENEDKVNQWKLILNAFVLDILLACFLHMYGLGRPKNEERQSKTARKIAQVKERGGGGG